MITGRCKHILESLGERGYAFEYIRSLSGGINSSIHLLNIEDNGLYVLKVYPLKSINDPRNRCLTEMTFLDYLCKCELINVPKILDADPDKGWSLLSWIDGQKLVSLTNSYLSQISDFILGANSNKCFALRADLKYASDSLQSLDNCIASIETRISQLTSVAIASEVCYETVQWIKSTLVPVFDSLKIYLLNEVKFKAHWLDFNHHRIASPSDIGIHNILQRNGCLYFLDFEYAGLDDVAKLAADLILQPKLPLNTDQESFFLKSLERNFYKMIPDSWLIRTKDLKPLYVVKWSLIMLNSLKSSRMTSDQLESAMNYFSTMEHLIS